MTEDPRESNAMRAPTLRHRLQAARDHLGIANRQAEAFLGEDPELWETISAVRFLLTHAIMRVDALEARRDD